MNKFTLKEHLLNGGIVLGVDDREYYYFLKDSEVYVYATIEDLSAQEIKAKVIITT